jgi:UDP-N-acetylmuramoyl-tripeptide--D-alanyl-D-alanine ligase
MSGLTAISWIASAGCWASLLPAGARWLRVSQREHYLAGSATRFAVRWWVGVRMNAPLWLLGAALAVLSWRWSVCALGTGFVAFVAPVGLSVRGRTSALRWTRRLVLLSVTWGLCEAALVVVGFAVHRAVVFSAIAVVLVPAMVDLACLALVPVEGRLASRFVAQAAKRLRAVHPLIVGITGSFGKTSTKNYVTHLLTGRFRVVASPASFNNRAGLARAVNEHLLDGTEIFVAEMGTYGPGEIAELCQWCPPTIAVITAIGPVHLERFGSEDAILAAKSEIVVGASTVVLNIDDDRLGRFGDELAGRNSPPVVIRCSATDRRADVCVIEDSGLCEVVIKGSSIAFGLKLPEGAQPTNVACAIGVAYEVGVSEADLAARLKDLPTVPHRLALAIAPSGVVVIDDTFNSNPAGARAALRVLVGASGHGRRVVVTPGMIELGPRQAEENRIFGRAALEVATDLVVVGQTNRSALVEGGSGPITLRTRDDAVRWVRENLSTGDAVLYENDLPDHYP